jgi:hypothetical protein
MLPSSRSGSDTTSPRHSRCYSKFRTQKGSTAWAYSARLRSVSRHTRRGQYRSGTSSPSTLGTSAPDLFD